MYDFIDLHGMHQKVCKITAQTFSYNRLKDTRWRSTLDMKHKKITKNETNFVIFYSSQETNNGKWQQQQNV